MIITGGKYRNRKIIAPDERITRPTLSKIRQCVFNSLYSMIGDFEGKSFLDLFGGSGIMGLEALSRGFEEVLVFEKNPKIAQILKKNYQELKLHPELKIGDSLNLIKNINHKFDVIYIDPPYYQNIYTSILEKLLILDLENTIIVVEHVEPLDMQNYTLIKEKKISDKKISFMQRC